MHVSTIGGTLGSDGDGGLIRLVAASSSSPEAKETASSAEEWEPRPTDERRRPGEVSSNALRLSQDPAEPPDGGGGEDTCAGNLCYVMRGRTQGYSQRLTTSSAYPCLLT